MIFTELIFMKLILPDKVCKEIHIEDYANPMSSVGNDTGSYMDEQTERFIWFQHKSFFLIVMIT
jgi:hypothetical protein